MLKMEVTCNEVECSQCCFQNRSHEDRFAIAKFGPFMYYGVFDGHGGGNNNGNLLSPMHVVLYIKDTLHHDIANALSTLTTRELANYEKVASIIASLFGKIDKYMYDKKCNAGCTASIILIHPNYTMQINLGDSRSIIYNNKGIVSETRDHTVEFDRKRIEGVGSYIENGRVEGYLEPSRSFGDFKLKIVNGKYSLNAPVSAMPVIKTIINNDKNKFIIGTDGLTNAFRNSKKIISFINEYDYVSKQDRCDHLGMYAANHNGEDDVCILMGNIKRSGI